MGSAWTTLDDFTTARGVLLLPKCTTLKHFEAVKTFQALECPPPPSIEHAVPSGPTPDVGTPWEVLWTTAPGFHDRAGVLLLPKCTTLQPYHSRRWNALPRPPRQAEWSHPLSSPPGEGFQSQRCEVPEASGSGQEWNKLWASFSRSLAPSPAELYARSPSHLH